MSEEAALDRYEALGREEAVEVLFDTIQILSAERDTRELIRSMLEHLRAWTGCEAAGLRLREGEDFPYFQVDGFPPEFVELENTLCARGLDGSVMRDSSGDPILDCMCGNVLSGRFDPEKPFFTAAGSFYSNCTTELLASTTEEERLARTRNRCNGEGYESVLLIPLRASGETIGLVQLNDKRRDRFSPGTISILERIAGALATALAERRAKDALRASEERYAALFEENLDGVLMTVPDGTILDANPASCAMLGMTKEEICARGREGLVRQSPELAAHVAVRRQTGRAAGVVDFIRKDGSSFPAEFSSVVISRAGEGIRAFVIFRDITERQRVAELLRRSEEMLRYIIKHDPNAIAVFDRDLCYMAVSDRYLADYDVQDTEVLGKRHYDVFPEMPQRWKDVHERVLAGAVERSTDDSFERPDGTVTYDRWECRPWYDVDGSIAGMITYTEVTTERKKAEIALRESERKYHTLFDTMLEGSTYCQMVYDEQGEPIDWTYLATNAALERIPGFAGAMGKTAGEMFPGIMETNPELLQTYASVAASGQPQRFRTKRGPSGRWYDIAVSSSSPGHFVAVFEDVTEALESEERLRQAQKMEAVGHLAGGIAHDFNNLLTAIIGYSDLALASGPEGYDGVHEDVTEIKAAAERAASLTRQILAFSRRQTLKPEVVSLNEVVTGTERLLRRTLGEDIRLDTRLGTDLGLTEVDVSQMEQVLMNLAVNSRDAMPEGGSLSIETANAELSDEYCRQHTDATPGPHVMLAVSDTGTGIDPETKARVLEPFFTTKEPGKGTGLGLSTVYGIVSQSGGSLSIQSELGQGTEVRIYLPRVDRAASSFSSGLPDSGRVTGDETVLLVEDEAAVRALVGRVLGSLGYTVIEASSGDEGYAIVVRDDVALDILVTDVVLPGTMQGNHLADAARIVRPDLPILFVSGYARDAIVDSGRLRSGVNYLEKPFAPADLARRVREILDLTSSDTAAPSAE